jgi:ATP-binding cassette, subfamily B, bacterial
VNAGLSGWRLRHLGLPRPNRDPGTPGVRALVPHAPAIPFRQIFRRFWPYARPYRRYILLTLPFIVLIPALQAVAIWLFGIVVDDVLIPGDYGPLAWIAPAYVGITLVGGLIGYADSYLTAWVSQKFVMDLRTSVFRHIGGLAPDFLQRRRLGDLLSRLGGDVSAIETFMLSGLAAALAQSLRVVFFAGAMFILDWRLALVALAITPVFWWGARRFSAYVKRASREKRRRSGSIMAVAEQALGNATLVQANNREEAEIRRFQEESEGAFRAQMDASRLQAAFAPAVELLELVSVLLVILAGTWAVADGGLTIGGLLVFLTYLSSLYSPIRGLTRFAGSAYAASASAERIVELLDERPAVVDAPDAVALTSPRGVIAFQGVDFAYPGSGRKALRGVSFAVGPGETLALVGASGAGKSTIAKLVLRFYDPSAGVIRFDGQDIRGLGLASLRGQIAIVLQETLILAGTVRENIAYGRPGATSDEVVAAARAADAHEFIRELPEGYETELGHGGRRLSGGQCQRIAIARAMVRKPSVLIMDEPTTGLDSDSGDRVMKPLRRLMSGCTTIVISHNLALARDATRIVVLDRGEVVEIGSHDELMTTGGAYASLSHGASRRRAALPEPQVAAAGAGG